MLNSLELISLNNFTPRLNPTQARARSGRLNPDLTPIIASATLRSQVFRPSLVRNQARPGHAEPCHDTPSSCKELRTRPTKKNTLLTLRIPKRCSDCHSSGAMRCDAMVGHAEPCHDTAKSYKELRTLPAKKLRESTIKSTGLTTNQSTTQSTIRTTTESTAQVTRPCRAMP